jgi:predicted RNA binding protein YcfA (HicA-like mRNA interferase family)
MKVRDLIKLIEQDGWYHVRTTGSHRHDYHATKTGTVTIPGQPGKDVPEGTRNSVMKQAGLKK